MKFIYKVGADIIWLAHFLVVCIALFGWLVPSIWLIYIAVLVGTLISTLRLGFCILSKWEYDLRKRVDPKINYDFTYASFYTYRLTQGRLSGHFLAKAGVIFVSLSLAIQSLLLANSISAAWLNYVVVLFVMFLVVLLHAYREKKSAELPRILLLGALSGIVPGILADLIFGKYLGLATYALGFGLPFLIFNGFVGYGLFAANTLLMQRARLAQFCIWTVIITAGCEITNLFTHSWTYLYPAPSIGYWIVAFGCPLALAMVMAAAWHILFGYRFVFIENLLGKK